MKRLIAHSQSRCLMFTYPRKGVLCCEWIDKRNQSNQIKNKTKQTDTREMGRKFRVLVASTILRANSRPVHR